MDKNKYIDHTLLKANASKEEIVNLCKEAKEQDFASVCVNPSWISLCKEKLEGADVKVCTVIGFPLGSTTMETKAFETKDAISKGATEIDMVINIGKLKDRYFDYVYEDIKAVVDSASGNIVKVIIETCLLTDEEKEIACQLSEKAGANFVKTSTGFSTGGATIEDVKLMRKTVSENVKVKASGGVRSSEDFENMIKAGAERIGTSSGVKLMTGDKITGGY
ncbi:MAG: deoxyribose-phosphate aldolase [Lachnospirales bacterium]